MRETTNDVFFQNQTGPRKFEIFSIAFECNQMNSHCNPNNACPGTDPCRPMLALLYLSSLYSSLYRHNMKLRQDL